MWALMHLDCQQQWGVTARLGEHRSFRRHLWQSVPSCLGISAAGMQAGRAGWVLGAYACVIFLASLTYIPWQHSCQLIVTLLNGCELSAFRFCMFVLQVHNAFKIWMTEMFWSWRELPAILKISFQSWSTLEKFCGFAVMLSLANQSIFTLIFAFWSLRINFLETFSLKEIFGKRHVIQKCYSFIEF